MTRDTYTANLSVRPSARHLKVRFEDHDII